MRENLSTYRFGMGSLSISKTRKLVGNQSCIK